MLGSTLIVEQGEVCRMVFGVTVRHDLVKEATRGSREWKAVFQGPPLCAVPCLWMGA